MKYLLICFVLAYITPAFAQESDSLYEESSGSEYDQEYEDGYEESSNTHTLLDPKEVTQRNGYDNADIRVQKFDEAKWRKIVGSENFQEAQSRKKRRNLNEAETGDAQQRGDQRIKQNDEDEEEEADEDFGFSMGAINSPILNILFYALVVGLIAYLLYLIIKNSSLKQNVKKKESGTETEAVNVENIQELEIDRLLREALASGNYRLAIRIYFLGLLKQLDQDGLIVWKKNKTNRDYLSELFLKERYFDEVQTLTLAYEQVWYGDHDLSTQSYEQLITSFKDINQRLKLDKPTS